MKVRLLVLSLALALLAATAVLSAQRPANDRLDVTPAQLATPPEVSVRLAWAARNLAPSGLQKLERMGTSIAPGIPAGTAFPAVTQQAEGRVASAFPGLAGMDVSEAAFIVLSLATKDMDDDIRLIIAEVKAVNAAKQKLRDLIAELNRWISEEMSKRPGSEDIDSERATKGGPSRGIQATQKPKPLPMPRIALVNATSPVIHVEYLKAPVIPRLPARDSGTTVQALKSLLDELKGKLDGMNEMSEMTSLRLQMALDRRSKFISTLSQMMKKDSTTQDNLVQNIK